VGKESEHDRALKHPIEGLLDSSNARLHFMPSRHGIKRRGGTSSTGPAVTSWSANRLDLFAKGTDNALYHMTWDGTQWSSWYDLGGTFQDAPAAVSWGPNRIDVCVHGDTGHIGHYWWG
jgi:hypothetical protein